MARSVRDLTGQATARHGKYPFALTVLCTILFLTFLDNTIVSVALGSVWTDLHASVAGLQWVVGAYALTFASAMLAFGMVGDEFGRKRVMLSGAAVFCAGSVLSALAPNVGVLIAGRAVMGLGAAASEPGTLSMLRQLYTDDRARARAVGIWTAVSALALAFGPVIGGVLVGLWSWRAVFWFNLIFGLAALVAAVIVLPESSDPTAHRVDIGGTVLGAACLTALSFAIIDAETAGFASPLVIILLIVSVAAGAAFFWQERRVPHPLLDPRYLRVPRFLTANVTAFCAYFATFAVFFFSALYLAEVVGYSGYQIAAVYLPMTALMIVSAVLVGRWMPRAEPRMWILGGCVLFAGGLLLTTVTLSPHPAVAPLAVTLSLTGIGIGTTLVPVTSSALSAVPAERSGMAASATNTSREIGAVTGVAVLGSLVISQLLSNLNASMVRLGIPPVFRSLAESIILTGRMSGGASNVGSAAIGEGKLVVEMENAAFNAFSVGLHAALYLSAALVLAAGLFTFVFVGRASRASGGGTAAAYQASAPGYGPGNSGYAPGGPGNGTGSSAYPPAGPGASGYAPPGPGYGSGGPGYAPEGSGYGTGGPGYPSQGSGYGTGGPGYPTQGSGYGSGGPGYAPEGSGYGTGGQGYPSQGSVGYETGGPGYPSQDSGYGTGGWGDAPEGPGYEADSPGYTPGGPGASGYTSGGSGYGPGGSG